MKFRGRGKRRREGGRREEGGRHPGSRQAGGSQADTRASKQVDVRKELRARNTKARKEHAQGALEFVFYTI